MPSLYTQRSFSQGYFYHIYNRGAHKQNIFLDKQDYETFLEVLSYYLKFPQGKPLSKIKPQKKGKGPTLPQEKPTYQLVCFCLMPNHYHFLLKQTSEPQSDNNISNFMKRLSVTYTMYFNNKYQHSGSIFQGKYKNTAPKTNEQFLYLTKYIHRNPQKKEGSDPSLKLYPYSSYKYYINQKPPTWLHPQEVLSFFSQDNPQTSYKNFIEEEDTIDKITSDLTLE